MSEPFRGQIRKEDVRAVEKDRVEMYRSFRWSNFELKFLFPSPPWTKPTTLDPFLECVSILRPGDIALARVISLGDAGAGYLLTTAENELGVVIARFFTLLICFTLSKITLQCEYG